MRHLPKAASGGQRSWPPLLAEVERLVVEVGWHQARPVVEAVRGPLVKVTTARSAWRRRVGKRSGGRLLADLAALSAQQRLPLAPVSRPVSTVHAEVKMP